MKYFNTTHMTLHPDVYLDKGRVKTQVTAFARSSFRVPEGSEICKRWLAMNPGALRPIKSQEVAQVKAKPTTTQGQVAAPVTEE